MVLQDAEGIPQYMAVGIRIDKNGPAVIRDNLRQFLVRILLQSPDKQIRTAVRVDLVDLISKPVNVMDVCYNGSSDHITFFTPYLHFSPVR